MYLALEIFLATLLSALALLSLPRRRVRENLARASRLGRIQYGLLVVPSNLLAALLWLDIWNRSHQQSSGPLFTLVIGAGMLWGLILAASGVPAWWSGRTPKRP